MNCQIVRQHYDHYIDNILDTEDRASVQAHLSVCPDCAKWFDSTQSFDGAIDRTLRKPRLPTGLTERLSAAIEEETTRLRRIEAPSPSPRPWWPVAAALATFLAVCGLVWTSTRSPRPAAVSFREIALRALETHRNPSLDLRSKNPVELARLLSERATFPVHVPDLGPTGTQLVGGAWSRLPCSSGPIPCALVQYATSSTRITRIDLLVPTIDWSEAIPLQRNARTIYRMQLEDHHLLAWRCGRTLCILLVPGRSETALRFLDQFLPR